MVVMAGGDAAGRLLQRPARMIPKSGTRFSDKIMRKREFSGAQEQGGRGMAKWLAQARFIIGALALVFVVAMAAPASAQQPSSVNPTASSVKEDQLLAEMNRISGRCTIPDQKACTIEQPAGRDWREFHQKTLPWVGAIATLGMLALLVIFYLMRGMVKIENGRSGRLILRFNAFERGVHWMTATCFVVLAITGLNITFGKQTLLPLLGPEAFTTWSQWGKYAHNYLSFPFTLGVVLMLLMWIANNIPNRVDIEWIKRGGGMVGNDHPPAYKFNAGQKGIYWIVVIGGSAVAASGYLLMFPFYGTDIAGMQLSQIVHGTVSVLFVAAMLAHIYIGTIGMEGAFEAMAEGTVDENWAKQHHSLWLVEEKNKAPTGATPRATPAE
jgi:formate dehydrogenase subunit gamma